MRIVPLMAALVLAGCSNKDDEDTGEQEMLGGGGGDGTSECAGAAPVITSITCTNAGLDFLEGMGEVPWLAFEMQLDDEDENLDGYRLEVCHDETIDGAVVAADSPYTPYTSSAERRVRDLHGPLGAQRPHPKDPRHQHPLRVGLRACGRHRHLQRDGDHRLHYARKDGTGEADPENLIRPVVLRGPARPPDGRPP